MFLRRLILIPTLAALILPLSAEPLPEGHFVDFIVVPVGPVPLAEFESGAVPEGGGQGSGVRVKEVDPTEVPPNAVYVKKGGTTYQIPCFLNAIGTPVRVPVADTEITFQTKTGTSNDGMTSLDKCVLPADARCVLNSVICLISRPRSKSFIPRSMISDADISAR